MQSEIIQNLPPAKNWPFTNSSTPNSSRPTPTKRTLFSSSRGFRVLSCLAPRRQKGHPNRRKNVITHGCFSQSDSMATNYNKLESVVTVLYMYYHHVEYLLCLKQITEIRFKNALTAFVLFI